MIAVRLFPVSLFMLAAGVVSAQDYPQRPIRIVTAEAGGGADFSARLIAQGLSAAFGQQVLVDNRGGNAVIPAEVAARAPADGYTLLLYSGAVWTLPLLQHVSYDPVRDFAPITVAVTTPNMAVVHPSLPVSSIAGLLGLAKARPGELNYSAGGTGSNGHFAAELFKSMAGVNIVRIAYKGAGPALNDLIAGQVQVTFSSAGTLTPHVKSGRLKALAITSARPSQLFPGMPTVAAALPGYESVGYYALFAPVKTPAVLISRLNEAAARTLGREDVRTRLANTGMEPTGSSPEALATTMKSEMTRLGNLIRETGMRSD